MQATDSKLNTGDTSRKPLINTNDYKWFKEENDSTFDLQVDEKPPVKPKELRWFQDWETLMVAAVAICLVLWLLDVY